MSDDSLIVATPLGQLRGKIYETARAFKIYSFQGIPYGKPPINELRFKVSRSPSGGCTQKIYRPLFKIFFEMQMLSLALF